MKQKKNLMISLKFNFILDFLDFKTKKNSKKNEYS